ncbi:MAG: hypothetical protein JW871_05530 [Endomicrobiales bacterium]|nr:hypothetical protein [Endomicrobiales bacterium]
MKVGLKESFPVLREVLLRNLKANAEDLLAAAERFKEYKNNEELISELKETLKRVENSIRITNLMLSR